MGVLADGFLVTLLLLFFVTALPDGCEVSLDVGFEEYAGLLDGFVSAELAGGVGLEGVEVGFDTVVSGALAAAPEEGQKLNRRLRCQYPAQQWNSASP